MTSTAGFVLLILLLFVSLAIVSAVNRWQTRTRMLRQKVAQLRKRISELEEICNGVEPLLESSLIPRLINEEIMDLIKGVQRLDNQADHLTTNLENATDRDQRYTAQQRVQSLNRVQTSDAGIAKRNYYLGEATRLVRRHQALGRLQKPEVEEYVKELAWARLMTYTLTYVAHGQQAAAQGDRFTAFNYFRKAQNMLVGHPAQDDRRYRLIRELAELAAGDSETLSRDLMPEQGSQSQVAQVRQTSS